MNINGCPFLPSSGNAALIKKLEAPAPHKLDENLWRNREQIEEILSLVSNKRWPSSVSYLFLFCLSCGMFGL